MWLVIENGAMRLEQAGVDRGPTLQEMQETVGGLVTRVGLYRYRDGRREIDGWMNDEGLLLNLPQSVILPRLYPDGSGVRGPLLIAASDEEGNTVGLTRREYESFILVKPYAPLVTVEAGGTRKEIGEFPFVPTLQMRDPEAGS